MSEEVQLEDQLAPPPEEIPPPPVAVSSSVFQNQVLEFEPCENPDCALVSLDGIEFRSRKDLLGLISTVFSDMIDTAGLNSLQISEEEESTALIERIELVETSHVISLLLTVAHSHPPLLPDRERRKFQVGKSDLNPKAAHTYDGKPLPEGLLPFENVRELIHPLGQKYQLSSEILYALCSHLSYHTPAYPLETYALASALAEGSLILSTAPGVLDNATLANLKSGDEKKYWSAVASDASQYLLTPTLTAQPVSFSLKFPTSESYAALLYLQLYRIEALHAILTDNVKSVIFPFDYGICKSDAVITRKLWDRRRESLRMELDAGTDVAEEMRKTCEAAVRKCVTCSKGVETAVEMLRYLAFKIPIRISDLPRSAFEGSKTLPPFQGTPPVASPPPS